MGTTITDVTAVLIEVEPLTIPPFVITLDGTQGPPGPIGLTGPTGATGAASIVPGPQGEKGDVGEKGDTGNDGKDGADGAGLNITGQTTSAGLAGVTIAVGFTNAADYVVTASYSDDPKGNGNLYVVKGASSFSIKHYGSHATLIDYIVSAKI